jgi:DNA ligase-1
MSLFQAFAEVCDALAATTKKLEKRALMADYLHALPVEDAGRAALWLAGSPFAETDGRVLNIGGSLLQKAVGQLAGASAEAMGAAYRRYGDFGAAAADLLYGHAPDEAALTLEDVERGFAALAEARGPAAKLRLLLDLLRRAVPDEAKYLIKLATGDMRTGVKQSLVEEAIAEAWGAGAADVRRASMRLGSLPEVVRLAAEGRLAEARMKLFHPLGFMLASPVQSVDEAVARFTEEIAEEKHESVEQERAETANATVPALREAQLEDKFDGIRAQLHVEPGVEGARVALYSRNRDDLSAAFPELVEAFAAIGEAAILDGEILAWNAAAGATANLGAGRALPFGALQQRLGRKRVTAEMRREVPVVLVVFDALYRAGRLLLEEPLAVRRRELEEFGARWAAETAAIEARGQSRLFGEPDAADFARLMVAGAWQLETADQLDAAYAEARARGNEGVMIKSLASAYQPGRRGLAWLKLKRELATLDVVVTGVEYGNGRRAAVLSDYTFAIRDPEDGSLKNVGKAYSGLTDAEITEMTEFFKAHTVEDFGHFRTVEPVVVLEVAFNNVMRSERHASGFALRFPRILRIRRDKPVEEIDTLARVEEIYHSQPDRPVETQQA